MASKVNVGTLGNINHGKTTLTAAISSIQASKNKVKRVSYDDINNAPENGIDNLIKNISFVEYETKKRSYNHFDCPTNDDYVKTIVKGTVKIDGAILVVSATDGPMPQTREHIKLLRETGVSFIVVYLNKCDLQDDEEMLMLMQEEITLLLSDNGYSDNIFIRGSALKALNMENDALGVESIDVLLDTLDSIIPDPVNDTTSGTPHRVFKTRIYILTVKEGGRITPIFPNYKPQFRFGNQVFKGVILNLLSETGNCEMIMPGDNINSTIELVQEVDMTLHSRFDICEGGRTIGCGFVTEILS